MPEKVAGSATLWFNDNTQYAQYVAQYALPRIFPVFAREED